MATIMERALTCPVRLPRVISGFMLPISQRRSRIWSRLTLKGRRSSAARRSVVVPERTEVGDLLAGVWGRLLHFWASVAPLVEGVDGGEQGISPCGGQEGNKKSRGGGMMVRSVERWFG